MPNRIVFPEFRDEFEFTRYPFADGATLVASNTSQEIEKDTFLDASLYIIGALEQVHISSVDVTPRLVTIWFSDRLNRNLASTSFDPLDPPVELEVQDAHDRPAGVLVSDAIRLSRFSAWDSTTHNFPIQATEFAASCVIPTPEAGVRGVLTEEAEMLAGDIWLVGDNGVVLREDGDCVIRVDIVGDPLFVRKLCQPIDLFDAPLFIKTINGCPPDEYGDFQLTVGDHLATDTVLRINPVDEGLQIEAIGELVRARQ